MTKIKSKELESTLYNNSNEEEPRASSKTRNITHLPITGCTLDNTEIKSKQRSSLVAGKSTSSFLAKP